MRMLKDQGGEMSLVQRFTDCVESGLLNSRAEKVGCSFGWGSSRLGLGLGLCDPVLRREQTHAHDPHRGAKADR